MYMYVRKCQYYQQAGTCTLFSGLKTTIHHTYMLWFNFILGLNFIFPCLKLIIIYYHTQKQKKIKFKPRTKLNHNIYTTLINVII